LDAELAATWDVLKGYSGRDTDLGIARRFGVSAAAYSLRDIGAMNGRVVKVRRDLAGEEADPEEDFSANQVSSGALENWVNGKLESTLPVDVDPTNAKAGYSLRKVKKSYSGDAVRIRRSSDDAEVNVAFDADRKVSANSSISTVSGSTTATDLNGFLNEKLTVGTAVNGTGGFDNYTLTNVSNTGFSADNSAGGTGSAGFPYKHGTGDVVVIRYTVSNFSSTSSLSPVIRGTTGVGSVVGTTTGGTEILANGTRTETLTAIADGTHLMFADGNTGSYTISNFEIVSHTHQAFVHTWYDQAGSNNAVQATDTNQPKIAENGALLADGLDFDGTNDYLEADGVSSIYTGTDEAHSSFVVVNSDAASTTQYILGIGSSTASNPLRNTLFHSGGNIGWQVRDDVGTLKTNLSANPYVANQTYLVSALNSGTTIDFNTNSVINNNGTDADVGASTINTVHIGTRANSPTGYLNGSIQELVFYASDQSNNRFKIESNINNYYGLYNDANDFSTSTWQNGGTGSLASWDSLTNSSTDGFVASTDNSSGSTENAVCSLNFANIVPDNGRVFVSFNCEFGGTAVTAANKSLRVQLRDSSGNIANDIVQPVDGGDGATAFRICNQGFNRVAFTVNSSTASNIEFLLEVANGRTGSATVTDLKVSRIARNGFVETWYDQSGSGRDAVQITATEQPSIVKNGGIVKVNGKPAIDFDGVDNYFDLPTNLNFNLDPSSATRPVNTIMFVGQNDAGNRSFLGTLGSTKNWIGNPYVGRYQFRDNGSNIYDTGTTATTGSQVVTSIQCPSEDNFTIRENGSALTLGGTNNITANISISDIGAGYTGNYQTMKAQEFSFYQERLTNDIVDIENDAINYYNI
jgi:hypothetical protein